MSNERDFLKGNILDTIKELERQVAELERQEVETVFGGGMTYWDDLRFPATAIHPPGAANDPDYDTTDIGWLFDANSTETLHIVAQLPHRYKEGSDIWPHLHWEPTNSSSGNVKWRLSYRWRNDGEAAGSWTNVDITVAANGHGDTLQMDSFGAISKSDALISSILDIKLSRLGSDAADTYAQDVRLKEFDIHYELDSVGSTLETSK